MKNLLLAAFAVMTMTAAIAPMAHAAQPATQTHTGPYDNTQNSLGGRYIGGGDGGNG